MRHLSLLFASSIALYAVVDADLVEIAATSSVSRRLATSLTCSLQNGVDFVGNDIGSAPGALASDCCAKCGSVTGCGAFTWTAYNGGTCWLKSSKGSVVANPNAKSAIVSATTTATASTCTIETGVDYSGNDIGSIAASAASDCCAKCSARSGCGAFTWTNYNGGTCWLKSGKGATTANAGALSGVVASGSPSIGSTGTCPTVESNVDYAGSDIGSVAGSGAADCCTKCSTRSGCGAFTWTNFNGGTCWLKSGKGTSKVLTGAISAVLTTATTTTTPAPSTPAVSPSPTPTAVSHIQPRLRSGEIPLRSVNLGGWLVSEYWMSTGSQAWKGVDYDTCMSGEYYVMQKLGAAQGTAQFEAHRWSWITESDLQQIAAAGMNAVRVPVGFWIVNDDSSTTKTDISKVYAPGSLKFLDKLINEWAVKYNLAVMVSLHAHQGSQNGLDHSAPQLMGTAAWGSSQANIDNSLQFATFIAGRYKNSVAFLGLNLMNEPSGATRYDTLLAYYTEAYARIRSTGNDCIIAVSPMLWDQGPPTMSDFMRWPQYYNVWHEFHVYYKWTHEGKNETQIVDTARPYRKTNLDPWTGNWIFMGEWSLAAPEDTAPFQDKDLLKQYAAIQLANYEGAHSGWAFWSWRHDEETTKISGWSLRQLLREGIFSIPKTV